MYLSELMTHTGRAAFVLAAVVSLAACGQKGPLYLPDEGGEVITRPAEQTQSPETPSQPSTQTPPENSTRPESEKNPSPPR